MIGQHQLNETRRDPIYKNPATPSDTPHLHIYGKLIVWELLHALCHAAISPDYGEYMIRKHNWMNKDCEVIKWEVLKLALKIHHQRRTNFNQIPA